MPSALAVLRFKNSSASQARVTPARRTRYNGKTMEMPMRFIPIGSEFAAEVEGIDLCAPFDAAAVAVIHAGMDRHAVLVFHDQPLTDEQQIAFTRSLGKIELNTANNVTRLDQRRLSIEMSDISNLDQHSNMLARDDRRRAFNLGNRLWHSDSSFKSVSAKYSLLSARVIPSAGGNTEFADMRAAYDALDPEIKTEIEDLITEHSLLFSRGQLGFTDFTAEERVKFAPVRHRLVRTNPTTGRKSLFLSSHIGGIVGWPVPDAMAFVRDLAEHATQRQFVYAHTWRQHDLVMWDNRQTMHRARRYKETSEVRDMRRTTLEGDGPTTIQMAVA
jgi:alpha-ketoglutarate-dependent 2,4-dichlorophenoxyacetate dioxygenase